MRCDTFYGQPQDHRPDFDAIAARSHEAGGEKRTNVRLVPGADRFAAMESGANQ
jgi:hypothetical protein